MNVVKLEEVMHARFGHSYMSDTVGEAHRTYVAIDFECTHRHCVEENWVWFGYVVYEINELEDNGVKVLERGDLARPIVDWCDGCAAFWATQPEALARMEARCSSEETDDLETRHESNVRLGHLVGDLLDKYDARLVTDVQAFDPVIVHHCLDVAGRRSARYSKDGHWRGSGAILDTGEMARMLEFAGSEAPRMPDCVTNDHNPTHDAFAIAVHHGALHGAARAHVFRMRNKTGSEEKNGTDETDHSVEI